jgi:hypothetical protein
MTYPLQQNVKESREVKIWRFYEQRDAGVAFIQMMTMLSPSKMNLQFRASHHQQLASEAREMHQWNVDLVQSQKRGGVSMWSRPVLRQMKIGKNGTVGKPIGVLW